MRNAIAKKFGLLVLGSIVSLGAFAEGAQTSMVDSKFKLAYLMNNSLRVVWIDRRTLSVQTELIWILPDPEKRKTYAGLACGKNGQIAAHVSSILGDVKRPLQTEVVILDVKSRNVSRLKYQYEGDLLWPIWSPDDRLIAATTRQSGKDAVAIVDVASGSVRVLQFERSISPHSWLPRTSRILATSLDASGKRWETASIEQDSGTISIVADGGRPIGDERTARMATVRGDLHGISIHDGSHSTHIEGPFKDLIRWLDDSTIIGIVSIGLRDHFALVDIKSGMARSFETGEPGEINGACVLAGTR